MNQPQFFQTVMGSRFFLGEVPQVVKAVVGAAKSLESIATSLEALAAERGAQETLAALELLSTEEAGEHVITKSGDVWLVDLGEEETRSFTSLKGAAEAILSSKCEK